MNRIKAQGTTIPTPSLTSELLPADYSDAYVCLLPTGVEISAQEALIGIFSIQPPWVEWLFKIRNIVVKPFGLSSGDQQTTFAKAFADLKAGKPDKLMSIAGETDNEILLCLDDNHLKAYLTILTEKTDDGLKVYMSTVVTFKRKLGYIYFYTIYPFHHLVVKHMLSYSLTSMVKDRISGLTAQNGK